PISGDPAAGRLRPDPTLSGRGPSTGPGRREGRIAIVGAMQEEVEALERCLEGVRLERRAGREFRLGRLDGHELVLVRSGIGKVAAAATAAVLLGTYEAQALLFTGVAGGLGAGVNVGDIVVARALLQHDMDASPL